MQTSIETVTPEKAQAYLLTNVNNQRKLHPKHVSRYAGDILAGNWQVNGGTIVFSTTGKLLDGQHRLAAVMLAQRSINVIVVRGVDEQSFVTIDSGRPRNGSDLFAIQGEKYPSMLHSGVVHWLRYHRGSLGDNRAFSSILIDTTLNENPGLRDSTGIVSHFPPKNFPRALLVFIDYAGKKVDAIKTEKFMDNLKTGIGLEAGDPVLQLRERYMGYRTLNRKEIAAITIKALNLTFTGRRVNKLVWYDARENFPDIVGYPAAYKATV